MLELVRSINHARFIIIVRDVIEPSQVENHRSTDTSPDTPDHYRYLYRPEVRYVKPVNLTVEQIAKAPAVTFDWKEPKKGHAFGTIAQYWLPILRESVHGKEGGYSFSYAQAATVCVIKVAERVVEHTKAINLLLKHETEQDREIRELKDKVKNLETEVKRLRAS